MASRKIRLAARTVAVLLACLLSQGLNFVFGPTRSVTAIPRAAFEKGKVNWGAGAEGTFVESKTMPKPVLEANEATNLAIMDCLEEGCSVEALLSLDQKLAHDEATIQDTLKKVHASQAVEFSQAANEEISWLTNFLDRVGSLRAQLQAVSTLKADSDFIGQFVRAASIAFGGGRNGDYPKSGVSPYSA